MKIFKRILSVALCAAVASLGCTYKTVFAEEESMSTNTDTTTTTTAANSIDVTIDGSKAQTAENKLYRGAGMVSANNSSRLLIDYKTENPDAYWELMDLLFGEDGIGINHLKIEMGSDINSSSGTEPNVKRTEDETADVTRGAGYQLAADAKSINPDLTLDMLYWSEPLWVTNADDVYSARYKWYKETLDAAYVTYGLEFDYVSAVRNERAADTEWIKYLSKSLKSETDSPYDYSKIKIVAGEEVCTWRLADRMLNDEELLNAVDVVGSHYTSWASDSAKELADEYGKELWLSEGSSPMSYSQGTADYDGTGSGMSDINGMLDVANRIITMASGGEMTLYEYQPAVAAYYDGVTYCQKQLITANEPWSGYYLLDGGFYMSLHFSQFIKKGWAYVDGACYADGTAGGDGHAVVDATYSYVTATDTDSGDYSTVITNTTAEPITYNFTVKNLGKAADSVNVWETRGADGGEWNENYFKHVDTVNPEKSGDGYTFSVTVKPYSLVTISTIETEERTYEEKTSEILSLPYSDDYEYSDYDEGYLSSRGNAPRYTTDEGGAFEVCNVDGNNVLMQMITPETKSQEWGSTPNPVTNFGDDRWFNYSVSADVKFDKSDSPDSNYVGIGLRYNLADSGESGWWIQLYEDGSWKLNRNSVAVTEGKLDGFDSADWNSLKIQAVGNEITAFLNGETLVSQTCEQPMLSAGRAALYSSYNRNCFDNFSADPIADTAAYITRFDNTDSCVSYSGDWEHNTMSSFKNYKRTVSTGSEGAAVTVEFSGTAFALTGENYDKSVISVKIDGETADENVSVSGVGSREIGYYRDGLENGSHTAEITVVSGSFSLDGIEVSDGRILKTADKTDESSAKKKSVVPFVAAGAGIAAVGAAVAIAAIARKGNRKRKKRDS
jgi:hypothetical protein